MRGDQPSAASLVAAALDQLRRASALLQSSDVALAAHPTASSNARWFIGRFVFSRRPTAARTEELFWSNLERAREHCSESSSLLAALLAVHASNPVVQSLWVDLSEAGQAGILPALHAADTPGEELQMSQRLRPVLARMKVCEARMLRAIQALLAQSRGDAAAPT